MKIFKGHKTANGCTVIVDGQRLRERVDLTQLSGFNFGPGSDNDSTRNLAVAIGKELFPHARVTKEVTWYWVISGIQKFLQGIEGETWEHTETDFKRVGIESLFKDYWWALVYPEQKEKARKIAIWHGFPELLDTIPKTNH